MLFVASLARALPVVVPGDAASHVGDVITLEGDVLTATTRGGTCELEVGADGVAIVRVVLVIPLVTSLPRAPERLYAGRRVRATGKLQRFQGRLEMTLTSPDLIEIVDVVGPSGAPEAAPAPPPPAPPAASPAPTSAAPPPPLPVAPSPPPTTTPPSPPTTAPRGLIEALAPAAADPCATARGRWAEAARVTTERIDTLRRCLEGGQYRCRAAAAAVAPALSELEWSEQQVNDACPGPFSP